MTGLLNSLVACQLRPLSQQTPPRKMEGESASSGRLEINEVVDLSDPSGVSFRILLWKADDMLIARPVWQAYLAWDPGSQRLMSNSCSSLSSSPTSATYFRECEELKERMVAARY